MAQPCLRHRASPDWHRAEASPLQRFRLVTELLIRAGARRDGGLPIASGPLSSAAAGKVLRRGHRVGSFVGSCRRALRGWATRNPWLNWHAVANALQGA